MSYIDVLHALSEGDLVTFNDSGGANATETPELVVDHVSGNFTSICGHPWQTRT